MDATFVINLIIRNSPKNALLNPLLYECKNLLARIPYKSINHIFREANQCIDVLAKKGLKDQTLLLVYCILPIDILIFLLSNTPNVYYPCYTSFVNCNIDVG